MSPTLLELVIAVLLLWVAWQIGILIAPRVLASFVSFWRSPKPPLSSPQEPPTPEKNVTPPSPSSHENPR